MLHLADAEGWWLGEVASGVARTEEQFARVLSKETQQYDSDWPAAPHQPLDWYLGILEETRAEIVALIAPRSDLETKHTAAGRDRTYTLRWILFHVIAHESYHGGQMVMLKEQWKQTRGG
jgi:uncharacterized damage-inducible protein DinB